MFKKCHVQILINMLYLYQHIHLENNILFPKAIQMEQSNNQYFSIN